MLDALMLGALMLGARRGCCAQQFPVPSPNSWTQ